MSRTVPNPTKGARDGALVTNGSGNSGPGADPCGRSRDRSNSVPVVIDVPPAAAG
jgi:hypothetical protein